MRPSAFGAWVVVMLGCSCSTVEVEDLFNSVGYVEGYLKSLGDQPPALAVRENDNDAWLRAQTSYARERLIGHATDHVRAAKATLMRYEAEEDPRQRKRLLQRAVDELADAGHEAREASLIHDILVPNPNFGANIGAAFANAYFIERTNPGTVPATFALDSDQHGLEVEPYVELYFRSRYSWSSPAYVEMPRPGGIQPFDYEARLGFVGFDSSQNSDAVAASSSFAASDVYFSTNIGFNLSRSLANRQTDPLHGYSLHPRGSWSLEGICSFATDRNFVDVHPAVGLGTGIAVGVPVKMDGFYRLAEGFFGAYPLYYSDFPKFTGTGSDSTTIATVRGRPGFGLEPGLLLRAAISYPIQRSVTFLVEASSVFAYDTDNDLPPTWSVFVGFSWDVRKTFSFVTES